jgi:hypothetical protein
LSHSGTKDGSLLSIRATDHDSRSAGGIPSLSFFSTPNTSHLLQIMMTKSNVYFVLYDTTPDPQHTADHYSRTNSGKITQMLLSVCRLNSVMHQRGRCLSHSHSLTTGWGGLDPKYPPVATCSSFLHSTYSCCKLGKSHQQDFPGPISRQNISKVQFPKSIDHTECSLNNNRQTQVVV